MCGIAGAINCDGASELTIKMLAVIRNRGMDGSGLCDDKKIGFAKSPELLIADAKSKVAIGHLLHSVVGAVSQPLQGKKGILSTNCEIYNWKEIAEKEKINVRNDAELLLKRLDNCNSKPKEIQKLLDMLNGVWAFAYLTGKTIFLSRDVLGEKPLWYSVAKEGGLLFTSERKALKEIGCKDVFLLDPRQLLTYNLTTKKIKFIQRKFDLQKISAQPEESAKEKLTELLITSTKIRVPEKKFGLLFSGGIDSTLLAIIFKKLRLDFKCYLAYAEGIGDPKDLAFANEIADKYKLDLKLIPINLQEIPVLLEKIIPLIESSDPVRVGVALPIYTACQKARQDKIKVIFSGLGSDELFCGYSRFKDSNNTAKDSINHLLQMHESDLYRDDVISMNNNLELRLPYLDLSVVNFALSIEDKLKISDNRNKILLRDVAKELGLEEKFAERKKEAAQYGSNFDKALEKLAKKDNFKSKADYLLQFSKEKNLKLACLYSGGKDSNLALWILQKMNYEISCLVSIIPKNPDSYMYQKPEINILKLQSQALKIPLITKSTKGEKEKELQALKQALAEAKKIFKIQGVVSGALSSNYQRERIQNICTDLGLRLFSPLWHCKQEAELNDLIKNNFKFIISKIAAKGLDESWLGKEITKEDITKLNQLNKKFGFNVAGEGGEYESLVLDSPAFKKKIKIISSKKILENECTGYLEIKLAKITEN